MREKLAVGTDCRISALKCPLLLLFLRQCRLYILLIDKGTAHRFSRLLKMMHIESHVIYLTGSHYSSLDTQTEHRVNTDI